MPYKIIEAVTHDGRYIIWSESFETKDAAEQYRVKHASPYTKSTVVSLEQLKEKEERR